MAGKGYSAGRVTLQVVPSYKNFMEALRKDSPKLARAVAEDLQKSFEKEGFRAGEKMADSVNRGIQSKGGAKTGLGDSVAKDVQASMDRAVRALRKSAPEAERTIRSLFKEFEKGNISAAGMAREMDKLGGHLRRLAAATPDDRLAAYYRDSAKALQGSSRAAAENQRATAAARQEQQRATQATREHSKTVRKTNTDTNVAARGLGRLRDMLTGSRNDSQDGANAFRFFSGAVLGLAAVGPAVVPVIAAIGGALAALGPILLGVGAGFGVAALALRGIGDAVTAMGEQEKAAGGNSEAARRAQVASARSIADARRGLADAYRNSAESIRTALRAQKDAEERLADAQKSSAEAQRDLTQARKEAKAELQDLNNQIAQNALDERQGVIDLFNAYNQFGAVQADGGATNLEKEQADIGLQQAELNLKRIREEQKKLAGEKKKTDKDGVGGTDTVLRAQERLNNAIRDEKDAREAVGEAARDVDLARADGARSVADAQRTLRRALEDANTSAQGSAASVDKLAEAMEKLSPAGQRFARFIFGLRGGFRELQFIAQEGFLPGLQEGMEQIMSVYGPGFKDFIRDTSSLLGELSIKAGEVFTNDTFRSFFDSLGKSSQVFIEDFGISMLNWLQGFAAMLETATPFAERFSGGLRNISERFAEWASSAEGRESFQRFLDYVERVGPKVLAFFGSFVDALVNIGVALAPVGESILSYLTDFFDFIARQDPKVITLIAGALLGLVVALQVASAAIAVVSLVAAVGGAPILILLAAFVALGAAIFFFARSGDGASAKFAKLKETLQPLIDIVADLWKLIKEQLVRTFNEAVLPALEKIGGKLKKDLIPALAEFYEAIRPVVKFLIEFFGATLRGAIDAIGTILSGLITIFSGVLEFVTAVFNRDFGGAMDALKKIFSGALEALWGAVKLVFYVGIGGAFRKGVELIGRILGKIGGFFAKFFNGPLGAAQTFALSFISNVLKKFQSFRDSVKNIFSKIGGFIKDGMVGGAKLAVKSLNFLIGLVNKVAGWAGLKGKGGKGVIPEFDLARFDGFSGGGYTGKGGRYEVAGAVHRDEFVVSSPARGKFEREHPGALNHLNRTGELPGYSRGGRVVPGKGNRHTSGYPWASYAGDFPNPIGTPVRAWKDGTIAALRALTTSYGKHIRMNHADGTSSLYAHMSGFLAKLGDTVRQGQPIGLVGSTGNSTGPHLHFESMGSPYVSGGGAIGNAFTAAQKRLQDLTAGQTAALRNPVKYLKDKLSGYFGEGGKGAGFTSIAKSATDTLLGSVGEKLKKLAAKALDVGKDWFGNGLPGFGAKAGAKFGSMLSPRHARLGNAPAAGALGAASAKLYDTGGWLPPGLTTVMNKTGRPEPVFTGDQFDKMLGGGGNTTFNLQAHGADPVDVVNEFARKISRQQRAIRRTSATSRSN